MIKRIQIKQEYEIEKGIEGYDNENVNSIQNGYDCGVTIKNDLASRLKNVQDNSTNYLPDSFYLRNYAIKASMNSAYNGTENTTDMINYVLTRGCRFLDFEVYKDADIQVPVVSMTKNRDTDFLPLDNGLTISDALYYVNMYAFNSTSPNYGDPIFIQIRPKISSKDAATYETNKSSICYSINDAVMNNLSPLYSGKIVGDTPMNLLLGKIIIVMDDITFSDCSGITNLSSNMIPYMQTLSYGSISNTPLQLLTLKTDKYTCNVSLIRQVIFEDASFVSYNTNVSSNMLFQNYSCQIVPMMFWNTGGELCTYETLFNKCGGGIVPFSFIYNELQKNNSKYIDYPDPMFAFSLNSNNTTTIVIIVACLGIVGFIVMREIL
jgi:hypothetical protein